MRTESHTCQQRSSCHSCANLHLKSNSLTRASSGRHHLTFVLVNNVLDALDILVPVHRAGAELQHTASVKNRLEDPATFRQKGHSQSRVLQKELSKVDLELALGERAGNGQVAKENKDKLLPGGI